MNARANSPATKRERLLELLRSRTQADTLWTRKELAHELCCTVKTVGRMLKWLRDHGYIATRKLSSMRTPRPFQTKNTNIDSVPMERHTISPDSGNRMCAEATSGVHGGDLAAIPGFRRAAGRDVFAFTAAAGSPNQLRSNR